MKIEWLIAFYLFISVMMIVFNFGYLAYEKLHAKRFDARTRRLAELLGHEIERNAASPPRSISARSSVRCAGWPAWSRST